MRIGSLFSGIGGLELGLERAGVGRVVWQCEIDPFCRAVLAKHWPDVERFKDVRDLHPPTVDVLCGGFPCQDLSLAGKRAGLDGGRSGLWWEYARIIEEVQPRGIVIENVAGFRGGALDTVAGWITERGYAVECTRITAADVGAPHRRERVFVVAYADGEWQPQQGGPVRAERRRPVDSGEVMANAVRIRLEVAEHVGAPDQQQATARGVRGRHSPAEPRLGGVPDGLPSRMDGPGPGGAWPAGRGAPQGEWEAPRTLAKVPNRPARLKALGNAVVPQCAYLVGLRLRELLV